MGGHKTISGSTCPFVPQAVADIHVTGNPNPDCKGNYWYQGSFGGKTCYRRQDSVWFLWWDMFLLEWHISNVLGTDDDTFWANVDPNVIGTYLPGGFTTGNAITTLGPA